MELVNVWKLKIIRYKSLVIHQNVVDYSIDVIIQRWTILVTDCLCFGISKSFPEIIKCSRLALLYFRHGMVLVGWRVAGSIKRR